MFALPVLLQAQAIRVDPTPVFTTLANTPAGAYSPVLAIPGAAVHVCNYPANATPCTNYATTYTDPTETTACPSSAPLVLASTSTCVATTDAQGNYGFWVAPGSSYAYTVTVGALNFGPYPLTPIVTSTAAGISYTPSATGGQTRTLAAIQSDRIDAANYDTLNHAFADACSFAPGKMVMIPATISGALSYMNSCGAPVFDQRIGTSATPASNRSFFEPLIGGTVYDASAYSTNSAAQRRPLFIPSITLQPVRLVGLMDWLQTSAPILGQCLR